MYETQKKRRIRRPAAWLLAVLLTGVLCCQAVWADQRTLIPVGKAVGIKLFADGVLVVSVSPVQGAEETRSPAKECGLKEGDILLTFNGEKIRSTEHLQAMLAENGETAAELTVQRDGKTLEVTASPVVCEDGGIRLGAWIRDSMAGIGTVTYYDPATGDFGALGHGITDGDTMALMPFGSGSILPSTVKAVKKGSSGSAGELRGNFDLSGDLGPLCANTDCGIFGTLPADCTLAAGETLPVGDAVEGPATIRANVSGDEVREYAVEILKRLPNASDGREMVISVTDPDLIAATGGIVQGMSGSPIIQNGKLVGAVTHVLLSDATKGYGISMETMLNAGENV